MIARQDDEETPLLQQARAAEGQYATTLGPILDHIALAVSRLTYFSDPCPIHSPSEDIGVTHGDESQVGHYVGILFGSILPVFYAAPIELGGLSLDPPRIGVILSVAGLAHGAFQILFYARLHDRFGARALHITGVSSGIPIVILFPVINALARAHGFDDVPLAAAPNRASLGATSGITQMVATGATVIAPASAASAFSYSMQEGH
ncbi:hypothetical protein DFH29DRAFT_1084886 [Suillus ampliporus]|nr:hypothetical protein DFH29DRAFT_1084886 [Suillus ampliporus]